MLSRLSRTCPIRTGSAITLGQIGLEVDRDLLVLLLEVRLHPAGGALDQAADRDRLRLDSQLARVAARQVEQVVDHLLQLAGALCDHLGRLGLPGVERPALGGEHLRESLDHGNRRAQLVRDREHEVVLHLLESIALAGVSLELGRHLVEGAAQGRDLDRPADLHPGFEVAPGQAPGAADQAGEGGAHRVDQAGEEDQRSQQRRAEPGGDEDGRVTRVRRARASRACVPRGTRVRTASASPLLVTADGQPVLDARRAGPAGGSAAPRPHSARPPRWRRGA